jgi:site-specific DNA-adenine methylase
MGSKNRIAKYIVPIIQKHIDDSGYDKYLEPFVGGGNVIDKIKCEHKIGSDSNRYLIALLSHIVNNASSLPKKITYEQYKNCMNNKEQYEDWYVGFVGFCCSFGAKFFGGYARGKSNKGDPRNYALESYKNLNRQANKLKNICFKCCDFREIKNRKNCVIYCDPPYKNTTKYSTGCFPYEEFYDWCRKMSKDNIVLISEYSMPDDFKCIWQKQTIVSIDCNRGINNDKNNRIEKLFILNK